MNADLMRPAGGDRHLQTIALSRSLQKLQLGKSCEPFADQLLLERFWPPDPTQQRMLPLHHITGDRQDLPLLKPRDSGKWRVHVRRRLRPLRLQLALPLVGRLDILQQPWHVRRIARRIDDGVHLRVRIWLRRKRLQHRVPWRS